MWCIYNKVNAFFFRSKVGMAIFFAKADVKIKSRGRVDIT